MQVNIEFWDDYKHIEPGVTYIYESLRTKQVEDLISSELSGCKCEKDCKPQNCACLQRSGASYIFSEKEDINSYILNITNSNKPIYECNDHCNNVCGNKLVQLGPRKNLVIVYPKQQNKGFGLFTKEGINKGSFICEYAGEVITAEEAIKRFASYKEMKLPHNYIFCINENFGEKNIKTFIDPTFYGNVGRYINHSCEPNCNLIPIRINDEIPKLCIFAKINIKKDTEITFDYGPGDNSSGKKCLCDSKNCRGFLPFNFLLTEDL